MSQSQAAFGPYDDDAAAPGGTGSCNAKLRLITSQLDKLQTAGISISGSVIVKDSVTGNGATVSAFHNADNQAFGGMVYGLMTGGVAQLLNPAGNLDRQRETGADGIPAQGVPAGAASFAMAFSTTSATAVAATGSTVITPAAMSGSICGVAWSIQVGSVLTVDGGPNKEAVTVTATTNTTCTALFSKVHAGTWNIQGFVYNQERDAAGELDGANGAGTALAVEYEYNGGGPANGNYDRNRNLQGKGKQTAAISGGGTTNSVSLTLASVVGLQPGQQLLLSGGSQAEVVYVATNYLSGSTTVPLAAGVSFGTQTTATWSVFAPQGPGLTTMLCDGEGAEACLIYDPSSGNYAILRAANTDGMATANIPAESPALWNGATMDRQRTPNVFKTIAGVSVVAGTPATGWAPAGGKKFRLMGYALSLSTSGTIVFKDNATEFIRTPRAAVNTVFNAPPLGNGYLSTAANNPLTLDVSNSGVIDGYLYGLEE